MARQSPKFTSVRCNECGLIINPTPNGGHADCLDAALVDVAVISEQELVDILKAEQSRVLRLVYRALTRKIAGVEYGIDFRVLGRWVRKELRSKRK